jgi:hypothetical protein
MEQHETDEDYEQIQSALHGCRPHGVIVTGWDAIQGEERNRTHSLIFTRATREAPP